MKKICYLFLLVFSTAYGQSDNPYADFGVTSGTLRLQPEQRNNVLVFNNNDTTHLVRTVIIIPSENSVLFYTADRVLLNCLVLEDADLARFISTDPLTKKFPELTPYQYAGNTPVQAIDLDGLEGVFAAKVGIGITFGKTDKRLSASFNIVYANSTSKVSSEFTLGVSVAAFTRINDFKRSGASLVGTASAMFGKGDNSNLLGSSILSPLAMTNTSGGGGFNGGGLGITSINIWGEGKIEELSNFNWNALGRFSVGKGSLTARIMEDFPFSDRGSTGTFAFNYSQATSNNQSFSIGIISETFTDRGLAPKMATETDMSKNRQAGFEYYSRGASGAPSTGILALSGGYSGENFDLGGRIGGYGGRIGGGIQTFMHKTKILRTPLFDHDMSRPGNLFLEGSAYGGLSGTKK